MRRVIAQDDGVKLRRAAVKLLNMAVEGEPWALAMLADRLDGKAAQSVAITHSHKAVTEYTDAELVEVAFGSSAGALEAPESAHESGGMH